MENLKIRVANSSESKEVQELFFELGAGWFFKKNKELLKLNGITHIFCENGQLSQLDNGDDKWFDENSSIEITLPELRDLVVLKRNDPNDGTHIDCDNKPWYVTSDNLFYCFEYGREWVKENQRVFDNYEAKPIEKSMKEYLRKNNDGEYILEVTDEREAQEPHAKHWIEIPEGANFAWKSDGKYVFFTALEMGYRDAIVVWNRHTHPEELPFIDDEPSINDQYAEIEKVRQTLNQRQDQYGSFEDVAMITEQMVDIMRKGYYENLAYNQKMALYMICSKMARIVNGNPNHKDSWHDIAGYATLIDNELVSEKDMPF